MKFRYLIPLLLLLFSCHKEYDEAKDKSVAYVADAIEVAAEAVSEDYNTTNPFSEKETTQETKIIKTADLRFATDNLNSSFAIIQKTAKQYNAYIQNDNEGKDYYSIYRNITVRISNENFDAFLAEISKGVTYFDRKEISAQDVTEEFVDIEARLKAKKVLEARYLELLKKATKVSEMLEIESSLSTIREEIEVQEGRLRYLQNRVSLSTISIQMYTETEKGTGTTVSYGTKMWNAIKSGFNGLSSFFLAILNIWPFILILAIVFIYIRRRIKKRKQKHEENI